jgi:multimeric flavodoxin WrbA
MMKNILGIIGSPRKKGNTHVMVSRILDGARDAGATTESIFLGDLAILECNGCHVCWKGNHVCSKNDDMNNLYPKIMESDAIIFGTPVYWFGPSAIMKCFIDRFVFFNCSANRKKIKNKTGIIAVPFADRTLDTADLVVGIFEKSLDYLEMRLTDKILAPGVTKLGEVRDRKQVMEKCYRLGKRLAV